MPRSLLPCRWQLRRNKLELTARHRHHLERTIFANSLLTHRLRWYTVTTARLLLRRWQAAVLFFGLSAALGSSLLSNIATLAYPLLSLLAPHHDVVQRSVHLGALLAFAGIWAGMQRAQIEGGPFMGFLKSLPYTARQLRHVDVLVLVLANGPLLLLAIGAMAVTIAHQRPLAHTLLLGDVIVLALVVQLAVLEQRLASVQTLALAVACVLLAACFGTRAAIAVELLLGACAVVAAWRGSPAPDPAVRRRFTLPRISLAGNGAVTRFGPWRLSLAMLWRARRNELTGKALTALLITAGAWSLARAFEGDARSFPTIVIAQGVVVLIMSGMLRFLHLTHVASVDYFGALPLAPRWWRPFDLAVVGACCLPLLAALSIAAWHMGATTPWHGAASVASYLVLLAALSLPHLHTDRHAVVISTVVTGLWTAATFACLT